MEILSKLTPAETYLIRENSNSQFKELLKFTLVDLLLKKVLKSEEHEEQSHPKNPVRLVSYISVGNNFHGYAHKAHELPFLQPFLKNNELEVMFRHLVKMGFESAGSRKSFIFDRLCLSTIMTENVKNGFLNRLFVMVNLSEQGVVTKSKIDKALEKLEKELPILIESDPKSAQEILKRINGNIFLLKSLDFDLLKKIDSDLTKEIKKANEETSSGCSSCSGCYMYFDTYSESFDGGFDSASGTSGCGGGSGCSGCSGCGGCGGCGS